MLCICMFYFLFYIFDRKFIVDFKLRAIVPLEFVFLKMDFIPDDGRKPETLEKREEEK